MSNTLVIHPKDTSTDMLKYVYEGYDFDIIDNPDLPKEELIEEIKKHQRIIFLGHGIPTGLIHPDLMRYGRVRNGGRPFIIDESFVPFLRDKETISMWCYSDEFFKKHQLPGFHTGMIISEVMEANYMLGYCPLTKEELRANMVHLSKCLHDCLNLSPLEKKDYILAHYQGEDDITKFNRERIRVN